VRFRSKIDTWLIVVLVLASLVPFWVAYEGWRVKHLELMLVGIIPFLTLIFVFPTEYWFEGDNLIVRGGVIRYTIDLRSITKVEPTRDLTSSPALSLDRLRIYTPTLALNVSPKEKEEFLAELKRRAPQLNR
jgi:hypothetical protein